MCCRNDDAGEVPSKLEVLTSMASELATSAVENGRWHHAAASNALAEQLSPDGGSLLSRKSTMVEPPRMPKSASSVNFSSFFSNASSELAADELATIDAPAMTQSAASDSSSEISDAAMVREEQEEWAAGVIADVSMTSIDFKGTFVTATRRKQRSQSTESSDASCGSGESNSPAGFWCTRPGSACDEDLDDDVESWSSPVTSPRDTVEIKFSPRCSLKISSIPAYDEKDSLNGSPDAADGEFKSPTVVRFLDSGNVLPPPPSTVNVTSFRNSSNATSCNDPTEERSHATVFSVLRKTSSMSRSQSFSAFSALRSSSIDSVSSGERGRIPFATDNDQFRAYFAKFVDLVIVRETTAA